MSLNAYFESEKRPPLLTPNLGGRLLPHDANTNRLCPEKVCIITTDGRNLVGTLAAHDYTTNLVRPSCYAPHISSPHKTNQLTLFPLCFLLE